MSRAPWIGHAYGYVVCLVAVIAFLISVSGFVDALFERANPLQARSAFMGVSLTSFEAFRATYNERAPTRGGPNATPGDTLSTAELRSRYEALRADAVAQVSYRSAQRLVRFGLLILISLALFFFHWRWLRAQRDAAVD